MAAQVALRRQQEQEEELGISIPEVVTIEQAERVLAATRNARRANHARANGSQSNGSASRASNGGPSQLFSPAVILSTAPSPTPNNNNNNSSPTLAQQLSGAPESMASSLGRMSLTRSPEEYDDATCE